MIQGGFAMHPRTIGKTRRFVATALTICAILMLSSCGGSSVTLVLPFNGGAALSVVVVSDSAAISGLKPRMRAAFGDPTGVDDQVLDGDHHIGDEWCTFSISQNGHNYTVTSYGTSQFSSSMHNNVCTPASQQEFLLNAP